MNEIIKCSIGGISFTLEQNAYNALSTYIDTLKDAYKDDPDGEEILADIEARIAELILSAQSAEGVVARPLIDNIIKQLGMPNEIEDEKENNAPRSTEHTDRNGNPRIPRRLYRDLENSKLGGVCAGFAKYFGIDATWIRLAMFVPLLFSTLGTFHIYDGLNFHFSTFMGHLFSMVVVAYIVLWFVVPAASSARQKLEQNGERVTAQSIKANTTVAPDERERTLVAKLVMLMGNIMLIALKVFAAVVLIGLIIGGCVVGLVALSTTIPMIAFDFATGVALLSFFFVVLIPMFAILYLLISFIGSAKPNGKAMLIMLILWVIMLATMTISAIKSPADFGNQIENAFESAFEQDTDILYEEFSEDEIEEFRRKLGTQENTDGTISRTHIMEDTQVVLTGSTEDVDRLETNISFGSNGIEISDEGKSLVKIGTDGIKVEDEQIVSIKEEDGGFTMEIGGVKIKVNDEGGSVTAASNGVKEGHDYRVVDDIAVERHQKSDRVIIFCGEADDVRECKERLNFTNTEVTFVADKKYCIKINRSGEVDNGFAKLRNKVFDKIDADTQYGEFFVDDADVLVYYEIGKNADMYRKSFESLQKQFKKMD